MDAQLKKNRNWAKNIQSERKKNEHHLEKTAQTWHYSISHQADPIEILSRARQLQPISSSFQWVPNRNEVEIGSKGFPRALEDILQQVQDEREEHIDEQTITLPY